SEQRLLSTFKLMLPNGRPINLIDPIALDLLNAKLPNSQFLIPTPRAGGRYSGSTPSTFREDQFNTNVDYHLNEKNWLAVKFFFSNAPAFRALADTGANLPGFGADHEQNNRVLSVQHIHTFTPLLLKEARLGYNFIRNDAFPQAAVKDSDIG